MTRCSEERLHVQQKSKNEGLPCAPKGALATIVAEARRRFNVANGVKLSEETTRMRIKRGNLGGQIKSPMEPVEATLVTFCVQRARMGLQLNSTDFPNLANSLIGGTEAETAMVAYEKKRGLEAETGSVCGI